MADSIKPTREEFRSLARTHTVVPVWREVLADLETPVTTFAKIVGTAADDPAGFLLESVERAQRWGRFSFLGSDPAATLVVRGQNISVTGELGSQVPRNKGALAALEAIIDHYRAPTIPELPPFHGGVVGYLGYDVVREVENLPSPPPSDRDIPDAILSLTGHVTAFDHYRQRLTLIENVFCSLGESESDLDQAYDEAIKRLEQRVKELSAPLKYLPSPPPSAGDESVEVDSSFIRSDYLDAVGAAREHILAGDIFQVVISQRFDVEGLVDPFDAYRALRQINPSPYMYLVRHPEVTLVGSSPEPMVQVLDGRVVVRPIAGTRFRGSDEKHDQRLAAELAENPKEQSEHVMLVDLARNDIGRVIEFGSETIDELMTLERYSHVMHLTSQVSGTLLPGKNAVDVLRATFPAGTVSGAPKVRAMEIIDELEPVRRGPYAGVVGYLDFSGNLDTAIAIRTLVCRDGKASITAGAGIVADSKPDDEEMECHNKARALLSAVAASRRLNPVGE